MGGGPSESFHTFESYYRYRFILLSRMFLRFFLCLAILTVSCGFTLNGYSRFSTRVSMSETDLEIAPTMEAVEEESVAVPAPPAPKPQLKAKWLPVGNMMAPKMVHDMFLSCFVILSCHIHESVLTPIVIPPSLFL